jgi:hypothetical protein
MLGIMPGESFEFEFERDGRSLPVTDFVPSEGIVLDGESSAWPLGVAIQLAPVSPGTRVQWEQIQRAQGWIGANTFGLRLSVRDRRLRFEGLQDGLLPEGSYRASIVIGGYRFHNRLHDFTIPRDGNVIVKAKDKPDNRRVKLDRPVSAFDDDTRRIVEASTIDGVSLATWLADQTRRDSRKACVLNVLAKLRTPIQGKPALAKGLTKLIFADVDRVYAELEPKFAARVMFPDSGFREDAVIHTTHLRLLKRLPDGDKYDLHSVREHVAKCSLQLAIAVPDDGDAPQYADIDIDLGNPFTTPLGFVIHVGELLDPGKTDHIALRKSLADTGCKDFLYY